VSPLRAVFSCVVSVWMLALAMSAHAQTTSAQQSQVFGKVIKEVFSTGGDGDANVSSCVNGNGAGFAFHMNPVGNLRARCEATGVDLANGPGGSTTALTNESTPSKERLYQKAVGAWNLYVSADYEHFQKQLTEFEPAYKNYIWRGAIGADYLLNNVTLGGALRYIHDNGQFSGSGEFNPNFENNSYGAVLYLNTAPTESSFLSASVQYLRQNFQLERSVFFDLQNSGASREFIGNTQGHPDGNEYEMQVIGGYDFHFGSLSLGPTLALDYLYDRISDYSESGNTGLELRYTNQQQQSFTTKLGAHASYAISTSFGVIIPQIAGEYVHEFLDDQHKTDFTFVEDLAQVGFTFNNDKPDRDYFTANAGVILQLGHGIAPFVNFRTLLGYNAETSRQVTVGARFEF
jgi:uncharacterized protein YhjY with autotransporter beta-barrel domain